MRLIIALAGMCSWGNTVTAQTVSTEPIDIAYQKCVGNDTSCVTISDCAFAAYDKWNKEMEHAYKRLLGTLKKAKDKAAVKKAQAAWIAYRDATFQAYDNMFNIPGSKWCRARHDDRIDLVRARLLQLNNYNETFKKKPTK